MSQIYFSSSSYPRKIAANVCVSAVVRFRSCVLTHETKRGTKIKLQNNTSPQACINFLCAPSMGEGIERYRIMLGVLNPLQATW